MKWRWLGGTVLGLFAAGAATGYYARRQGVPPDEIGRWMVKGALRKALAAYDGVHELLPAGSPRPLAQVLPEGAADGDRTSGEEEK